MEKVSSGVQNSTVQGSIKGKVREGKGTEGKVMDCSRRIRTVAATLEALV